ncbi:MAG: alpha-L-rhamnosidase C-terminal domain-containing protein [Bacteroidaceae bacterium]
MKRFLFSITLFLLLSLTVTANESRSDWSSAQWITCADIVQKQCPNSWYLFRKTFKLKNVDKEVLARIAVDSKYWLYINGSLVVFEGGLKRTASEHGTYYDCVDIAPYLREGDNVIGVLVWYFGRTGFSHKDSGRAGLRFETTSEHVRLASDATWTSAYYDAYTRSPSPQPDGRLSEGNVCFDAQKELVGWYELDYKGKMPSAVPLKNVQALYGELYPRAIPQWRNNGLKPYVSVRHEGNQLICRLPYNCQITPYLKVTAPAGKVIDIRSDNYNNTGGVSLRALYTTKTGTQEYESLGWINGHEIIYTIPNGVTVEEVLYRETGYDTDLVGSFKSDDPVLNELWKRSARTLYVNMRDNYMDCPERERAQWWGDEVIELGEAFYALSPSSKALATKGINELVRWQQPDGTFFAPFPYGNLVRPLPLQMLASVGWFGFYTQYYYGGDSTFVDTSYKAVNRYLHSTWSVLDNGLCGKRPGDGSWAQNWADWGQNADVDALTNCWFYLALKAEYEFALRLGKQEDADKCVTMMQKMSESFNALYWTGTEYKSPAYRGSGDDRTQAMAVMSGLASSDKYAAIAKLLETREEASPYMEKYVLESLFKMGRAEQAITRMKKRYANMLDYDCTTLFELWNITPNATKNHAWSGGVLTLMGQYICGIEPTSPGFEHFRVAPQMGTLKDVSTQLETDYGLISMKLHYESANWEMTLSVPYGSTAKVVMPDGYIRQLEAGDHFLTSATAIKEIQNHAEISRHIVFVDGNITIPGYTGTLHLFTLSGVELPTLQKPESGYYILKAGAYAYKIQVQ